MIGPERGIIHGLNDFGDGFLELLESLFDTGLELFDFEFDFF